MDTPYSIRLLTKLNTSGVGMAKREGIANFLKLVVFCPSPLRERKKSLLITQGVLMATAQGTRRFATRHSAHDDFYTVLNDLTVSTLGLGTFVPEAYKEENYTFSYKEAIKTALTHGVNIIDTAANYRYGKSESEIGEAMRELIHEGVISPDEVVVCSKGGFFSLSYPFPENPYTWIKENIMAKGLAKEGDIALDQHCMTPEYLEWSCEESRKRLGVEKIDIFYLHNPETQLGFIDYPTFLSQLETIFLLFERLCDEGKIGCYGIAAWNAFFYDKSNPEAIDIDDVYNIAQKVGRNNHRFKVIQFPLNLAKTHALSVAQVDNKPLLQRAGELGLYVTTSSPFLQGHLFKAPFKQSLFTLTKTQTPHQAALQFARSAPNVTVTFFGSKEPEHVGDNLTLKGQQKMTFAEINTLFGL